MPMFDTKASLRERVCRPYREKRLAWSKGSARLARSNRDRFPSLANRLLVLVPLPLIFLELVPPVSAPFPVPLFYVECPVTGSATNLRASIVPRIPVLRLPFIYGHTASQVGNCILNLSTNYTSH